MHELTIIDYIYDHINQVNGQKIVIDEEQLILLRETFGDAYEYKYKNGEISYIYNSVYAEDLETIVDFSILRNSNNELVVKYVGWGEDTKAQYSVAGMDEKIERVYDCKTIRERDKDEISKEIK